MSRFADPWTRGNWLSIAGRFDRGKGGPRRDLIVVSSGELSSRAAADDVSIHPLNPLSSRRARFERITEVLGFADHLPAPELHNAYRVRRLPVVGEDELSDPEVGSAEYPPHREAFLFGCAKREA